MTFKFLCLNLWQGGNLMEDVLEYIRKENPDILVCQEVYNGHDKSWDKKYRSVDVFKQELGYKHHHFAPAYSEKRDIGNLQQGNAIFSNFPIKSSQVVFYDNPYQENYEERFENFEHAPRNLQQVVLGIKGKEFNIFNTQGIWGKDGEDSKRRFKMSETIISQIKDKQNVILAGDFNLKDSTQAILNIEKHLINLLQGQAQTSFNIKRKLKAGVKSFAKFERPEVASGYAQAVVDMILVSQDIKVVSSQYVKVDISDHLPLLIIFEV